VSAYTVAAPVAVTDPVARALATVQAQVAGAPIFWRMRRKDATDWRRYFF
jgi:hypothetical protein